MSELAVKKATRSGVIPIIALYGESGTGKTMSALLMARGIVGPSGKIAMVDTESRRGSLYADVIPGGYDVVDLDAPFSPARCVSALRAAYGSGAAAVVVDSGSHEWEGIGGVLDMAGENETRTGKPGLHCWKTPKFEHQKFLSELLRAPVPIIICLRAKYRSRQKKENGKTVIVRDEQTTPIQAEDFIFEMTAHAEILPDHSIRITKCSHPSLRDCFPKSGPITSQTGDLITKWCNAPGLPPERKNDELSKLKKKLWDLTVGVHNKNKAALSQYLWDEGMLADTESLEGCGIERISQVIEAVKKNLGGKL